MRSPAARPLSTAADLAWVAGAAAGASGLTVLALGGHAHRVLGVALAIGLLVVAVARPFTALLVAWTAAAVVPHGMSGNDSFTFLVHGLPVHVVDVAFAFAMVAWTLSRLLGLSSAPDAGRHARGTTHPKLGEVLVVALAVALLATLVGVLRGNTAWDIARDLRSVVYFLMIPVAWLELRSWRRLRIAVGVLVAGATLFTVVAVTLALMPDKLWPRTELLAYWQGQSRIYFENDYLLVVTTPMLFAYALAARSWPRRILAMGLVTLSAGAIALSLTRSIMVATTLACLAAPVVAGAWRRDLRGWLRPGRLLAFGGLLAAAAVAVLVGLGSLHAARKVDDISRLRDRFSSLVAPSRLDSSFQGRVTSYRLALDSVVLAPTIGHGVGALVRIPWAKARRGREVRVEGYEPAVDDLPLTILLKAGLLGLAVALGSPGAWSASC